MGNWGIEAIGDIGIQTTISWNESLILKWSKYDL
jgi:hypothetical protein